MSKTLTILSLILLLSNILYSETIIKKGFFYYYNEKLITGYTELKTIYLQNQNTNAYNELKGYPIIFWPGFGMSVIGAGMIGYQIPDLIKHEKINNALLISGISLAVVGFSLSFIAGRKMKKSISIFNGFTKVSFNVLNNNSSFNVIYKF